MKEREGSPLGLYMLGICALFLAGFLLLVILGAQTYRNTVAGQTGNNQIRGLLSYVSAIVRANDAKDSVYISSQAAPQGSQVLIAEDGSGYASRIYCHGGYLVEDYGEVEAPFDPENALKIGETDSFQLSVDPDDGSLLVVTDEGRIRLRLRSGPVTDRGGAS